MLTEPLLEDASPTARERSDAVAAEVLVLSAVCSITEGALSAVLALSAAIVEPVQLYTQAAGAYYVSYAVSAVLAPATVRRFGPKRCIYLGSSATALFILSLAVPSAGTTIAFAVLGGAGTVVMWTSQGLYLVDCATRFAAANRGLADAASAAEGGADGVGDGDRDADGDAEDGGRRRAASKGGLARLLPRPQRFEEAMALFSGAFASIFLTTLLLCKLLASLLTGGAGPGAGASPVRVPWQTGSASAGGAALYAASAALCLGAAALCVPRLREIAAAAPAAGEPRANVLAATAALLLSPRALLLAPTNLTFGLFVAFFPTVITSHVAARHGSAAAALLYAMTTVAAAAAATPLAAATAPRARAAVMLGGALALLSTALATLVLEPRQYTSWPAVVPLFALYGVGISVWQGSVVAVWPTIFPGAQEMTFAPLNFFMGVGSAVAFFCFKALSERTIAAICAAVDVVGAVAYAALFRGGVGGGGLR